MRTRPVARSSYQIYWTRALEFREVMRIARDRQWWSAVGLNAIHCLISAADAALVHRRGIRSAGPDHLEAATLLAAEVSLPEINKAVSHLRKAIARRNTVVYEDRELTTNEARELAEHAERFCDWALKFVLPA